MPNIDNSFDHFNSNKNFFTSDNNEFESEESKLRAELMRNYVPELRPVLNSTTITYVNISLSNIQIMNLVSNQIELIVSNFKIFKLMNI